MEPMVFSRQSIDTGSYLVHVYRNVGKASASLAGTVERLGKDERQAFHTTEELLQLLGIGVAETGGQDNEQV